MDLNTSHVLIYQGSAYYYCTGIENLNTSHVLIYPGIETNSIIAGKDLNTSHVLIYPRRAFGEMFGVRFKYISCSYLSEQSWGTERWKKI